MLTLDEAKAAARVLHNDDDQLIGSLIEAAQTWIERATGQTFDPAPADIKQVARMLVAHWYDMPQAATDEATSEVPMGVRMLIATRRSFARTGGAS